MVFCCFDLLRICYGLLVILSAFERKDSPFFWAQYSLGRGEKKRYRRLDVRKDDPGRADLLRIALHRLEGEILADRALSPVDHDSGWGWVPGYIETRWGGKTATGRIYSKQWTALAEFFSERETIRPSTLERTDCFDYVEFRTDQVKYRSGKHISKNTAKGELKLLGMLMDEAVLRGMARENPARRLRIEGEETAEKPEISEEEEGKIRTVLKEAPGWMRLAFHIGISTGLRHGECCLTAAQVRWADDQVVIEKPKGGRKRGFAIPIYEAIRPQLLELRNSRRHALFEIPASDAKILGIVWRRFFDKTGLPHLCFHCTRVTFVTRGMRAGIPEAVMMRMVNHGSSLISRVYQRWTSDDVRSYAALLSPDRAVDDAKGGSQPPKLSRRKAGSQGAWTFCK